MLELEVNIDLSGMSRIDALVEALEDKETLHLVAAQSGAEVLKEHLRAKYVPRNKRGNFWERVHDSTEVSADSESGTITMSELGIRLRYYGGDVYPGKNKSQAGPNKGNPTKALAVPSDAVPVQNGNQISPAFAGRLAFLMNRKGGDTIGYLVEGEERTRTRDTKKGKKGSKYTAPKKGGDLMYTLRSITRHKPDPNIIPSDEVMATAAGEAIRDYLEGLG